MKMLVENVPCGGISCNDTIMHAGGKFLLLFSHLSLCLFFFNELDIIHFCAVNAVHVFITNTFTNLNIQDCYSTCFSCWE